LVKEAFVRLQQAIESVRVKDPAAFDRLERDPEAFRDFAFKTHADAYLKSGLSKLSAQELVDIGLTPSTKDLATPAGLSQIVDVAIPVVRDKLSATDNALITEAAELIRRARLNASQ